MDPAATLRTAAEKLRTAARTGTAYTLSPAAAAALAEDLISKARVADFIAREADDETKREFVHSSRVALAYEIVTDPPPPPPDPPRTSGIPAPLGGGIPATQK